MAGNCARYNILIVDDKELDRNGVCYLIQQYGLDLHPIPAASGSEALEILRRMPRTYSADRCQNAGNDRP